MNASRLRQDIYRVLDRVLETGISVKIHRKGRTLRIVPEKTSSKLSRLPRRPGIIKGDPDDLVNVDWSKFWKPGRI